MKRKGSLLIESLIALMILSVAIIFIGRGLGPLKRMTDDTVIQQDLLDLGASVADMVLSGVTTAPTTVYVTLNSENYMYQVSFVNNIQLNTITSDMATASSTLPSTITVDVANATISTVGISPTRTLHFSVFPY